MDYGQELQFGVFLTPAAESAAHVLELARIADVSGLDLVTFQDHPYQPKFLDAWTLLADVAGQTANVRLALNVANLPLRPPFMLARQVASLDLLSGGRVELGLGAGAFWDGVVAAGGPRRTPGESVDALSEAIDLIRAVWDTSERTLRFEGSFYTHIGARPGPAPAHPVEIWLGAYKPRMLALTGEKGDGWIPSMGYADPGDLPPLAARIDAAAEAAGRSPAEIRRLYNVTGLLPAEQLAELVLDVGMSAFVLAASSEAEIRTFAEEIAPAVRELVDAARSGAPASSSPPDIDAAPFAVTPTATNASSDAWDEATRPTGPALDPDRSYTPHELATGQHLVDVHDALRSELEQLRDLIGQVAEGALDPGAAQQLINRLTIRQNNWTLGAYCARYCRIVTGHHTLEDRGIFPHLRRADARLAPVIDRLEAEHDVIAEVLDRVDQALTALVSRPDGIEDLRAAAQLLSDTLLSHLAYEERELVEPLSRLGFG